MGASGIGSRGVGVTCGRKMPDVGAGIRAQVLCKGSACFKPLSHLPGPQHRGFERSELGMGQTAQLVECLLCKPEDQSSNPRTHIEKVGHGDACL